MSSTSSKTSLNVYNCYMIVEFGVNFGVNFNLLYSLRIDYCDERLDY